MLILSRRIGEAVIIQDNVKILVLSTSGGNVRLGIEAPREIEVHREEVYRRLHDAEAGPTEDVVESPARDTSEDVHG